MHIHCFNTTLSYIFIELLLKSIIFDSVIWFSNIYILQKNVIFSNFSITLKQKEKKHVSVWITIRTYKKACALASTYAHETIYVWICSLFLIKMFFFNNCSHLQHTVPVPLPKSQTVERRIDENLKKANVIKQNNTYIDRLIQWARLRTF